MIKHEHDEENNDFPKEWTEEKTKTSVERLDFVKRLSEMLPFFLKKCYEDPNDKDFLEKLITIPHSMTLSLKEYVNEKEIENRVKKLIE